MKYVVGLPLLVLAAVFQATVLAQLPFFGGTLDLVLLLTLSWTLTGEWQGGAIWALVGGLSLDVLSGGPLGVCAICLLCVAYLTSLSEGQLWRSHILLPLATILLSTVGYHSLYLLALNALGYALPFGESLWRITLPSVLLNTLFMLPVYAGVRWLHHLVEPPPVSS